MTEDAPEHIRIALVTGAGSGLGKATATVLAEAGYGVAALDLDVAAAERTCSGLGLDSPSLPIGCDVSDADEVEACVGRIVEHFGRLDVVVNCAGIDHTAWVEQLSVEQWDRVIDVNLRSPFLVSRSVWPIMRRQGGGHIVNIASTSAMRAASGATAYSASKFGLLGFSRALNLEGRPDNIRVTTVIPGGMRTQFFDRFAAQGIPAPDPGTLQDPAHVALTILHALSMPPGSDIQELVVTSPFETGWP